MTNLRISRRKFLTTTTAALAAPAFVSAAALGKDERPAASERVTLAAIGWGLQGPGNTAQLMQESDCQVVAVCDVDDEHLAKGVEAINKHYKNKDCKGYTDYRQLLARQDIDAVMIAVPDHWHGILSVAAAQAGKDIYGEKPLAHTIAEQQAIVAAVKKHGRIWQTGSWQRSVPNFRVACELVRNGHIGKIKRVQVGLKAGLIDYAKLFTRLQPGPNYMRPTDPPAHIRYDAWLGPAQWEPYIQARHHINWRWSYNTGGSNLMDWIGHHCDIAHWGLDFDDTGPLEVEASGELRDPAEVWNACTKFHIRCKYPKDIELLIASADHKDINFEGTKWIGEQGWAYVDRGKLEASNKEWLKKDFDRGPIKLPVSKNHSRNFLDSIKSRQPTLTPAHVAHHSAVPGHLGYISLMLGRKIRWDPQSETIIGDHAAARMLDRPMRQS